MCNMTDITDPRDEEFREQFLDAFTALVDSSEEERSEIRFDLYAQPLHRFEWATAYIPGLVVYSAGGLFPFQAEGFINGYPFYYRSEWGSCNIKFGRPEDSVPYLPEESYYTAYDNEFEGTTMETFVEALTRLLPKVKRSQNLYKFECRKVVLSKGDGLWEWTVDPELKDTVVGWGYTPEEAYKYASEPSAYLVEHGFSASRQKELWVTREVNPTPVYVTVRDWPETDPVFI